MIQDKENPELAPVASDSDYAAPRIETVITPDDLEREVHYAGVTDAASPVQP